MALLNDELVSSVGNSGVESMMLPVVSTFIRNNEEDNEDWVEWREAQNAIFASEMADFCGVGYQSPKMALCIKLGIKERPPTNDYVIRMMEHGRETEAEAIQHFVKAFEDELCWHPLMPTKVPFPTCIYNWSGLHIGGTPDLVLSRSGRCVPVEIKCPFNWRQRMNTFEAVEDFPRLYRYGKLNAFVQCYLYALCLEAKEFYVCNYFTKHDHHGMQVYHYKTNYFVSGELHKHAKKVTRMLETKKLQPFDNIKKLVQVWAKTCFIERITLHEDPENDSK